MYSDLWSQIRTHEDWVVVKGLLEEMTSSSFKNDYPRIKQTILDSASTRLANELVEVIRGQDTKILEKMLKEIDSFKEVRLTIAREPNRKLTDLVSSKIKTLAGDKGVILWEVEPGILGGAGIAFEGRIGDYSLKKVVEDYWNGK